MHRRAFLKTVGFLSGYSILAKEIKASPEIIKKTEWPVAIFYPSHCASPIILANMRNWYKEAGLNVKLVNFPSMPKLVQTVQKEPFLAAQIPTPMLLMLSIKKLLSNEEPFLLLSILGVHGSALLVTAKSGIQHPKDLKNKRIATPSPGVIHYLLIRLFLEKYKLDLKRDTVLVELPLNEVLNKVTKNEVDAVIFPEPFPSLVEDNVKTQNLISTQFIWENHPCCALATKKSLFEREREAIKILTLFTIKAAYYMDQPSHRAEIIQELKKSRFHNPQLSDTILLNAFKPGRSDFNPYPYLSTGYVLVDLLQKYNLIPKVAPEEMVKKIFQLELVKNIYKELKIPLPNTDSRPEVILGEVFHKV